MSKPVRVHLTDAKVEGEKAMYFKLVDGIEPGAIKTTATHGKAIVNIDLDADGYVIGIEVLW